MKDLIHSAEGIRLEDFLKTHGSKLKHLSNKSRQELAQKAVIYLVGSKGTYV